MKADQSQTEFVSKHDVSSSDDDKQRECCHQQLHEYDIYRENDILLVKGH